MFIKLRNTASKKSDLIAIDTICRVTKEGEETRIYWQNNSALYDIDMGIVEAMLDKAGINIITERMLNDDHRQPIGLRPSQL